MDQQVNIAIIGAGTVGLSVDKEAIKHTDKILLIDHGPLGSSCACISVYLQNYWYTQPINRQPIKS